MEPTPQTAEPVVAPPAMPARLRRRHLGLALSLLLGVLLPMGLICGYLWGVAQDQYASTAGFTVRQEKGGGAADLLGGLAQFTGVSGGGDANVLYEFIQSQDMVLRIHTQLDLIERYARQHAEDPVFALTPRATIEDLLAYWHRMVKVSFDESTKLIELRVLAFTPQEAQQISRAIIKESQILINELNTTAHADKIYYAEQDLTEAQARLRAAREALTQFRLRTQIVDPRLDLKGQMGVLATLQEQLAEALISADLLHETTTATDTRQEQAQRRIAVIRKRIAEERGRVGSPDGLPEGTDYPSLMAEYEGLTIDREFAEKAYQLSLASLDMARAEAARQTLYLAPYLSPTLAQAPLYPRRFQIAGLSLLFMSMSWSILALVYYSIRDRR